MHKMLYFLEKTGKLL